MSVRISKSGEHVQQGTVIYTADNESDIQSLPTTCTPGSTCFCIETSTTYILNNQGEWKVKSTAGSGGGGGGGGSAYPSADTREFPISNDNITFTTQSKNYNDIVKAINEKTKTEESYSPSQIAQAINDLPSGEISQLDRIEPSIKRICRSRNLTLDSASYHVYELDNGNYYLAFGLKPITIWLKIIMSRTEGETAVTHTLNQMNYNNSINSNILVFPSGWETTPTAAMNNGLPQDENFDTDDVQYTNNSSLTMNNNAYSNNSPVLFKPSKIFNLNKEDSHPLIVRIFDENKEAIIADYMTGDEEIDLGEIITCTSSDVPASFDLSTIDKGYLLYTTNNMYILAVGDENWSGLKVNGSDKLDSETGETNFSTQNWNSSPCDVLQIRNMTIIQRMGRPPFCEGNNDNYYTNVMYNTQDILDPNGNVKVPANITIEEFKEKIFKGFEES